MHTVFSDFLSLFTLPQPPQVQAEHPAGVRHRGALGDPLVQRPVQREARLYRTDRGGRGRQVQVQHRGHCGRNEPKVSLLRIFHDLGTFTKIFNVVSYNPEVKPLELGVLQDCILCNS